MDSENHDVTACEAAKTNLLSVIKDADKVGLGERNKTNLVNCLQAVMNKQTELMCEQLKRNE